MLLYLIACSERYLSTRRDSPLTLDIGVVLRLVHGDLRVADGDRELGRNSSNGNYAAAGTNEKRCGAVCVGFVHDLPCLLAVCSGEQFGVTVIVQARKPVSSKVVVQRVAGTLVVISLGSHSQH